ncbi:DUF1266 domain-containing protein [Lactobacillus sp. YT155]|uniref:DUF1266 domain-containing protein n=1 Tax=Lactobacillus sp. YT155 TaxID=3060955 RepID=UPI00265FF9AC|nr:DUF1266 domain-containing protein [Lactobacillus sp. YT155]MDO1604576.1 DUF1266 domain-containing protein [Lactobacillus sp. YT155]
MDTNIIYIIVGVAVVFIIYITFMASKSKKINQKKGANAQFIQDDEMNAIEKKAINYGLPLFEYRMEGNIQGLSEKKINFIEYEGGLRQQWEIFDHDSAIVRLDMLAELKRSKSQKAYYLVEGLEASARSDEEAQGILTSLLKIAQEYKDENPDLKDLEIKDMLMTLVANDAIKPEIPEKYFFDSKEYAKAQKKAIKAIKPKNVKELYLTYGWDIVRLVALAKWSFWLGYISREEMDGYFSQAVSLAEKNGESWEEYGVSFLLGRTLDGFDIDDIAGETSYAVHKVLEKQNAPF